MRVSADKTDPGYLPDYYLYVVTCYGIELQHCITADEETGIALCHVTDEQGCLLIEKDSFLKAEIEGSIKITKVTLQ